MGGGDAKQRVQALPSRLRRCMEEVRDRCDVSAMVVVKVGVQLGWNSQNYGVGDAAEENVDTRAVAVQVQGSNISMHGCPLACVSEVTPIHCAWSGSAFRSVPGFVNV